MRIIACAPKGEFPTDRPNWRELSSDNGLIRLLESSSGGPTATPLQEAMLRRGLIESSDNLILAASTNSGKSTISTVLLAETVRSGGTALLIEPLRAIAGERVEALRRAASSLSAFTSQRVRIRLMTGDTALNGDELDAPPTGSAGIIVATPERLEAIWRRGDAVEWLSSVRCLIVDEFHTVADERRGPTLDSVISSFLTLDRPPRVVLMSATPPDLDRVSKVLDPCQVVEISARTPPLAINVMALDPGEDANDAVIKLLEEVLIRGKCIVFVSSVVQAESFARSVSTRVPGSAALAYHASLTSAEKQVRADAFTSGPCQVLVSTSALGMGVNLPAATILVRDVSLHGRARLSAQELTQMLGRAGRGSMPGKGYVVLRPTDPWNAAELVHAIDSDSREGSRDHELADVKPATRQVAAILARQTKDYIGGAKVQALAEKSIRGDLEAEAIDGALRWLTDSRVTLAHEKDGAYKLTTLGALGAQSMLPLELVAGLGRLVRNLYDAGMIGMVEALTPLDLLAISYMVLKPRLAVNWSAALPERISSFLESGNPSALFTTFAGGESGRTKAIQLVNAVVSERMKDESEAYKLACRSYATAAIVCSMANGMDPTRVSRLWSIQNLDGIRERLRDDAIFYLLGLRRLLEVKAFYFHLKTRDADGEQIELLTDAFKHLQLECLKLTALVAYSSPLGPLVVRLRGHRSTGTVSRVGLVTLRKLEAICGNDLDRLRGMSEDSLALHGIRRAVAKRLVELLGRS